MNASKRNPILRNNNYALDDVIGNLGDEMQEQQLSNIDGGTHSSQICATIAITAVTIEGTIKLTKWIF